MCYSSYNTEDKLVKKLVVKIFKNVITNLLKFETMNENDMKIREIKYHLDIALNSNEQTSMRRFNHNMNSDEDFNKLMLKSEIYFHKNNQQGITMNDNGVVSLLMTQSAYKNTDRYIEKHRVYGFDKSSGKLCERTDEKTPTQWDLRYSGMCDYGNGRNNANRYLFDANINDKFLFILKSKKDEFVRIMGLFRLVSYEYSDMFNPSPWAFYFKRF